MFDSPRRYWTQTAVRAGVKAYGYQFTQRLSTTPAMFGGMTFSFSTDHDMKSEYGLSSSYIGIGFRIRVTRNVERKCFIERAERNDD